MAKSKKFAGLDYGQILSEVSANTASLPDAESLFAFIVDDPLNGLGWLDEMEPRLKKKLCGESIRDGVVMAMSAIQRLVYEHLILLMAIRSCRNALGKPATMAVLKTRAGKRLHDLKRKAESEAKKAIAVNHYTLLVRHGMGDGEAVTRIAGDLGRSRKQIRRYLENGHG